MTTREQSEQKKSAFLNHFRVYGNVSAACREAGITRRATMYEWQESDPEFTAAYKEASLEALEALESEARRRGVEGTERRKPHFYHGDLVGEEVYREYSDTLLIVLLKALAPEKYRDRADLQISAPPPAPESLLSAEQRDRLIAAYRGQTEEEYAQRRALVDQARAIVQEAAAQQAASARAMRAEEDRPEDTPHRLLSIDEVSP